MGAGGQSSRQVERQMKIIYGCLSDFQYNSVMLSVLIITDDEAILMSTHGIYFH